MTQAWCAPTRSPDAYVVYKPANPEGTRLLHMFHPPGEVTNAPAILFFAGGSWATQYPTQFYAHATYFSTRGIVCIPTEYRTKNNGNVWPSGCVEDANSAVRYVRTHAAELGVDPVRIVAAGGSSGGHLAVCTAQFPDIIAAGENFEVSSVPNLVVAFNPVLDTSTSGYGSGRFSSYEDALALSPVHHLTNGLPPMLSFHGTADTVVPYANEISYQTASQAAGNIFELVSFAGRDHGFFNDESWRPTQPDTDHLTAIAWMEQFLLDHGFLSLLKLPNPVAHWALDDAIGSTNAVDDAGNHTASLQNMVPVTAWTTGILSGAVTLDGIDDALFATGYKGVTGNGSRSLSVWVRTTDSHGTFASWGSTDAGFGWNLRAQDIYGTPGTLSMDVGAGHVCGSTDLRGLQWHHVAAVLSSDGSPNVQEVVLYLDGRAEIIGATAGRVINTASNQDVRLGGEQTAGWALGGTLDDVTIWNAALSPSQVRWLFQCGMRGQNATNTRPPAFNVTWTQTPTEFVLNWPSFPGLQYGVESSSSLVGPWNFVLVRGTAVPASSTLWTNTASIQPDVSFFRVILIWP